MAKAIKVKAPKKPANLMFPGELLPAAAACSDGQVLMRPRMYVSAKETKKLFNWLGRNLNWVEHREATKVLRVLKAKAKKKA